MWEYNQTPTQDELYHYGVIGMKWGVRRYQNKGGSYTRKGLQVFDRSLNEYQSAKQKVKSLKKSGSRGEYRSAKQERERAKYSLKRSYKQLKKDYKADQGKDLYERGKTITGNNLKTIGAEAGIVIGSGVVNALISSKFGNQRLGNIAQSAIVVGGTAVNAIIASKTNSDNNKLRAYYGHSRDYK